MRVIDWILATGLLAEIVLLVSLIVSIARPEFRLWPPRPGSRRALAWTWDWTVVACGAGLVLAVVDYGSWILDDPAWILGGSAALALGAGLTDWAIRSLGRETSAGLPGVLSAGGPYRWSRNPQYLGDLLMALGVVLVSDSWRVAALGIGGAACLLLAPLAEERWLVERYGDAYEEYRRRVPRLLGSARSSSPARRSSVRKALRVVLWIVTGLAVLVLGGLVHLGTAYPKKQDPPGVRIEATAELLARGDYLFHHVAACSVCHTPHQPSLSGARIEPDRVGEGGEPFPLGSAGTLYAKNITPAALGEWTDGEIVRALRDGVSRDGSPLFPLMPYLNYRSLSRRDLHALVAYTRSLEPRASEVPERELHFPMNLIIRLMPSPAGPYPAAPEPARSVEYGRYLLTAASCGDCHSPMDDRGQPLPGRELSGGSPFPTGDGWVAFTANITPDTATGIGAWSRERFIGAFREREPGASEPRPPAPGERRSPMPWLSYAGMNEQDLGAIYDYLRTVEPVRHEVVKFARQEPAAAE